MHLLLFIMAMAKAAKPAICTSDFLNYPIGNKGGSYWKPKNFIEGGIRPSLIRVQHDTCRCLPKRERFWPHMVAAAVWVKPNEGTIRIEYEVKEEHTRQIERMLACMGEPEFTVEPMPYKSDIVYTDGRQEVFPRYPIWLYLKDSAVLT